MQDLQALVAGMSIEDKIGQLTQYNARLFLATQTEVTGPMEKLGLRDADLARVGSVLNFETPEEMKQIQDAHLKNDPNKIPMVFMMDVIHGFRTIYPIPLGMACSFDEEITEQCSRMAAKEASAGGVQVTFAPMVDYVRDPRWGRVMETGGEEPLVTGRLAKAQVRGFHGKGVAQKDSLATCVKHFAGYGGAEAGRDYNLAEISLRELRQFYLPAYKDCIDAGAMLLMPSFNALNGIPSTVNPLLMKRILKEEWGFDGVVISDYNAVGELVKHGVAADEKEAARKAFGSGCDMEMCSCAYFHHLKALIAEGVFSPRQLDEAVLRVLKLKDRLGLFEDPYHGADGVKAEKMYLCAEHRAIARKAAQSAAVLLKNEGILPFSKDIPSVALIGPYAEEHKINGFWSCHGKEADTVSMHEGVSRLLPGAKVTAVRGCGCAWEDTDCSGFPAAVEAAKNAQIVILCLGEPEQYSGEGNCRTDLRLPGMQEALLRQVIAANPHTAVVLFNGRPLDLTAVDAVAPAILEMWFPGTEGGNAAAALLFGDANPSGKLTMSFPAHVGQCPVYYNRANTGRPHFTADVRHKGYASDYIDAPTLPLYRFGHGLSYSNFRYKEMKLSAPTMSGEHPLRVDITVVNTGDRAGSEVVQLYIRDMVASVIRPVQQLIDFQKVSFAAGEEKVVSFTVTEPMLRFWNFEDQHVSEPGTFRLMVGYADHFLLTDTFELV